MQDLLSLTPEEITALCESLGEKPYRGRQVFEAVYGGHIVFPCLYRMKTLSTVSPSGSA